MAGKLRQEIKQKRPFSSVSEEVILSMIRTADQLMLPAQEALRAANLSFSQYNVLRILRGAGEEGLSCGEVSERMVRRDPDLTRLIDRLQTRHLVERARSSADRRVVTTTITAEGLRILKSLDEAMIEAARRPLAHMTRARLAALAELLEEARSGGEDE